MKEYALLAFRLRFLRPYRVRFANPPKRFAFG
jgi:hypothetical protein